MRRSKPEAQLRARGRRERALAPEVDLELFTQEERELLFSADAKVAAQRRPPGLLADTGVLAERERVAVCKYLTLGRFGVWRPEFASMTDEQVTAAINRERGTQ